MSDISDRLAAALSGRYRIGRELGEGGMATVYLAEDLKHHRDVAIKVLKPELAAVLGAERFVQEIATTAALQHPNILPLHDSGEADGLLYYVMPYVEGESLRDRLNREKQLPVREAVDLTAEVADALEYAHEHGVVHRDIKPENILLHAGRPMVADFGIALAVSAAAGGRMTETGLSLGTPHYMSPEQATAEKDITGRSDVYSLASVLYEMLTGEPPHLGGSAQQIIVKIVTEEAAPVTKLRKSVPPNVAAAVGQALEKLPADRFDSAKAFAEALNDAHFTAATAGATGTPTPTSVRAFGWWIRSPWSWGAVAVAAGAAAAALLTGHRAAPASPPLFTPRTFESQSISNARFAPDGRAMVFDAVPAVGTTPRLFVIRPDHPDPVPLGPDSTHLLSVSTTGEVAVLTHATYIGFRLFTGTLATLSLGGEAPHELATGVREAAWGPDGTSMAVIRDSSGTDLLEYPVGTVLVRSQGYLSDPAVSPSGDAVAYIQHPARWDDRGFAVIADHMGHTVARSPEFWGLEGLAWRPDGRSILYSAPQEATGFQLAIRELYPSGRDRVALSGADALIVQDVSRDGRLLLTDDRWPLRLVARGPDAAEEREMGVRDLSSSPVMSRDGRFVAFCDAGALGGTYYTVLLRKTDGSPPVRLGEGAPVAVSDDNGLVLAVVTTSPPQLMLYPTGPGTTQRLDSGQFQTLEFTRAAIRTAGRDTILFFCGAKPQESERCYLDSLPGGSIAPVTPPGIVGILSPDGGRVLGADGDSVRIYPVGGGTSRPVRGLRRGDRVLRWSPDGREIWVWADPEAISAVRVDRVDPESSARAELLNLVPSDLTGVRAINVLTLADDPHVYAYDETIHMSQLYTVDGLR